LHPPTRSLRTNGGSTYMRSPIRALATLLLLTLITAAPALGQQPTAWVNELHYDNDGGDTGEFIEVVVEEGFTDLADLSVVFYNGSNSQEYDSESLDNFDVGTTTNGFTIYSALISGIQNGAPDGFALCYSGSPIQFLSYEGTFTASGGCADGVSSTDIGVSEEEGVDTPEGASLGLEGTGSAYEDFTWTTFETNSRGDVNAGQTLEGEGGPPPALPLLLSEIVVTPTGGEFVEIYNPNDVAVDLSNVYLTDATFAPGGTFYYNIVTGSDAGGGGFADFHARFPDGASIGPDEFQTIAMAGAEDFSAEYGENPTYELFENAPGKTNDPTVPDMREALPGSINDQGGLTNGGEVVVLYKWDGTSDLVQDLDYAVWGDKNEAVDKTGVSIDGPDADSDASDYAPDTPVADQEVVSNDGHSDGSAFHRVDFEEGTETTTGGNGIDGNDETSENLSETWEVLPVTPGEGPPSEPPAVPSLVINEIDYDQPGGDDAEFIEILNTGDAPVNLGGVDLVLVNGSNGTTYDTIPLNDTELDPGAYYVLCGNAANVDNCAQQDISSVQNGSPDAAALVVSGGLLKLQQQTIIDAVSYEGSVPGFVEGTGTTAADNNSDVLISLSRFPDGADTDDNDADFSVRCASPGIENFEVATDCENTGPPGGAGTATLANVTGGSPLSGTDIFDRNSTQSLEVTVQNDAVGKTQQAVLERVSIMVPAAWGVPTVSTGDLSGAGFSGASVSVDGQTIEITGASVSGADTGTLTLSGLTTPNPTAVTDDGTYVFEVQTAGPGQSLAPIGSSPTAFVIIPVANLRDIDADGNTVDGGDVVAIEVVSSVSDGVFSTQDLIAYGQDATAGIGFFVNDALPTFTEGNTFVVKGPVSQFNGLTQLQPDPSDIIGLGTVGPLSPSTLTIAQILADAENLEGQLLNINGVQITGGPGDPTFQGNTNYTVSDGTASIEFRIDADTDLVGTPLPNGEFNLFAILGQFDPSSPRLEGYQLLPRRVEDLFFGAPGQTTVQFSRASGYTIEGGTA
ncbi:MAG: hypothetical protein GVY18_09805, partial [Bacteroidetes bacterium]|nr:hypothetical protein [Bacteroidota bacterium]